MILTCPTSTALEYPIVAGNSMEQGLHLAGKGTESPSLRRKSVQRESLAVEN